MLIRKSQLAKELLFLCLRALIIAIIFFSIANYLSNKFFSNYYYTSERNIELEKNYSEKLQEYIYNENITSKDLNILAKI